MRFCLFAPKCRIPQSSQSIHSHLVKPEKEYSLTEARRHRGKDSTFSPCLRVSVREKFLFIDSGGRMPPLLFFLSQNIGADIRLKRCWDFNGAIRLLISFEQRHVKTRHGGSRTIQGMTEPVFPLGILEF